MRCIIFLFIVSLTFGQWSSFQLSSLKDINKESRTLFRYGGLMATNQPLLEINGKKRIALGGSLNKGLSNSGIIPLIHGQIKVSWNLTFRGRMASYSSKEGAVQLYGWGFSLRPGKQEALSKWIILFDAGNLTSYNQFKLTAIQAMGVRSLVWKKIPTHIGFGINIINPNQYALTDNEIIVKSKIQSNFIYVGTTFNLFGFKTIPQLWAGSDYNLISISIVDTF